MKVGPVSLTLNALRPTKKKSSTKKRKEPVEAILMEDSVDKKKRKAAAAEAMKRLSQFLIVPQGVELLLENIPNIEVKNLLWKSPAMMRLNGPVEPNPTSTI